MRELFASASVQQGEATSFGDLSETQHRSDDTDSRRLPMARVQHLLKTFVLVCVFGFTAGLFSFGNQLVTSDALASRPAVPPKGPPAAAEGPETGDKTLSPYFFVKSDHPDLDQLPLNHVRTTSPA
jgi:hypothetical protein